MVEEEEFRCLLVDEQVSRGQEASHLLLVVALGGGGLEVAGNNRILCDCEEEIDHYL